jgi:CheY-like chemotaxis protein
MLGTGRLILIAEDDADLRETLRRALTALDFEVALATDGSDALRQIELRPPSVLITDIYMPHTDGFELINSLRTNVSPVPIIAISGREFPSYDPLLSARRVGVEVVLEKPFKLSALLVAIHKILGVQ